MPDLKEARALLDAANRDSMALSAMAGSDKVADEVFGFLVQQGLEKSLKAWICLLNQTYPFTHDLTDLLNILDAEGVNIYAMRSLAAYNPFAVELRYESLPEADPPLDRAAAITQVDSLLTHVESLYSSAVRANP
jgi:HEPN domain-containing protein